MAAIDFDLERQIDIFRLRMQVVRPRETHPVPENQLPEFTEVSTNLLRQLYQSAERFLSLEEFNQKRNTFNATHLSPSVGSVEDWQLAVFSDSERVFAQVNGSDKIEPAKINVKMLLHLPERTEPLPLVDIDGQEKLDGDIEPTNVGTADEFFVTEEERLAKTTVTQLDVVKRAIIVASVLGDKLSGVQMNLVHNNQPGHILLIRTWAGETTHFIPHLA